MATKPGKTVKIQVIRGVYDVREKQFIRNGKAVRLGGRVRRGNS